MLVVGNQQDTTNDTYKEIPNPKHSETLEQAVPVSDTKKLSNILIKASKIKAKLFRIYFSYDYSGQQYFETSLHLKM